MLNRLLPPSRPAQSHSIRASARHTCCAYVCSEREEGDRAGERGRASAGGRARSWFRPASLSCRVSDIIRESAKQTEMLFKFSTRQTVVCAFARAQLQSVAQADRYHDARIYTTWKPYAWTRQLQHIRMHHIVFNIVHVCILVCI